MQRSTRVLAARLAATSSVLREPTAVDQGTLAQYDAAGADYATTSTKEFLQLQRALIPYRIVRLNEELKSAKELGTGALPGSSNLFYHLAVMAICFMAGKIYGRNSFLSLQRPPLNAAETEQARQVFAARQEQLAASQAVAEAKRLARLEKDKAREEKDKDALAIAVAAAEERKRQKALSRERGY